jgi:hypothetical protein
MIDPKCDKCNKELDSYGALMFSPPFDHEQENGIVNKYHICHTCWVEILIFIGKIK